MTTANELREVTAEELNGVDGGFSPAFLIGVAIGYAWELPVGATKEDAAAALGVSHLL